MYTSFYVPLCEQPSVSGVVKKGMDIVLWTTISTIREALWLGEEDLRDTELPDSVRLDGNGDDSVNASAVRWMQSRNL